MKNKKGGVFLGKPVKGAKKPKSIKKFKTDNKMKSGKREKKKYIKAGVFKHKKKAKEYSSDLEKVGLDTKMIGRKVRTRGGGPKIESSFTVYQRDK